MPVLLTSTSTRAEALDGGGDERLRLLARGDLAGADRDALAATGRARACAASSIAARVPLRTTLRALLEEAPRGGLADAAAAAGDEDDLAS